MSFILRLTNVSAKFENLKNQFVLREGTERSSFGLSDYLPNSICYELYAFA